MASLLWLLSSILVADAVTFGIDCEDEDGQIILSAAVQRNRLLLCTLATILIVAPHLLLPASEKEHKERAQGSLIHRVRKSQESIFDELGGTPRSKKGLGTGTTHVTVNQFFNCKHSLEMAWAKGRF
jgi:hypothetical protein